MPHRLTSIRMCVIGGILVCLLLVLLQHEDVLKAERISLWITCSLLVVLSLIVLFQDFSNTVSLPSLFYFWILFIVSRLPQVLLLINGFEAHCTLHIVTLGLAVFGFVFECFPLTLTEKTLSSPEEKCSHASDLLYGWLDPLFWRGIKSPLTKEKVPALREIFAITNILDGFYKQKKLDSKFKGKHYVSISDLDEKDDITIHIDKNVIKHNEKNIVVSLTKSFGSSFLFAALMKLVQDLAKFAIPQLLKGLIAFVNDSDLGSECGGSPWVGYFFAVAIILSASSKLFCSKLTGRLPIALPCE